MRQVSGKKYTGVTDAFGPYYDGDIVQAGTTTRYNAKGKRVYVPIYDVVTQRDDGEWEPICYYKDLPIVGNISSSEDCAKYLTH